MSAELARTSDFEERAGALRENCGSDGEGFDHVRRTNERPAERSLICRCHSPRSHARRAAPTLDSNPQTDESGRTERNPSQRIRRKRLDLESPAQDWLS